MLAGAGVAADDADESHVLQLLVAAAAERRQRHLLLLLLLLAVGGARNAGPGGQVPLAGMLLVQLMMVWLLLLAGLMR